MKNIPDNLSQTILGNVKKALQPNAQILMMKCFVVHLVTAVFTLMVCPQYGVKFLKLPINLMHTLMVFGQPICDLLCGLFFTASSIGVALFFLSRDEIRALRFRKPLLVGVLILPSIGFFSITSPNIFLGYSVMWIIGATVGVVGTIEISSRLMLRS